MILEASAFEGRWQLARRIDDRLAQQEGILSGTVDFTAHGSTRLEYHEVGELRLGRGPAMQAQRRYNWNFERGVVIVTFEDGSDFHQFVPSGVSQGSDHPCGDDLYTVSYDFTRWPQWQATWIVRGPRKDYTSVSTYMRA